MRGLACLTVLISFQLIHCFPQRGNERYGEVYDPEDYDLRLESYYYNEDYDVNTSLEEDYSSEEDSSSSEESSEEDDDDDSSSSEEDYYEDNDAQLMEQKRRSLGQAAKPNRRRKGGYGNYLESLGYGKMEQQCPDGQVLDIYGYCREIFHEERRDWDWWETIRRFVYNYQS